LPLHDGGFLGFVSRFHPRKGKRRQRPVREIGGKGAEKAERLKGKATAPTIKLFANADMSASLLIAQFKTDL